MRKGALACLGNAAFAAGTPVACQPKNSALIPIAFPSRWVIKACRGSCVVVGQAFSK